MREIKFRFWSGERMFYGLDEVLECLKQQLAFNQGLIFPIQYDHVGKHGASFMQFTGLTDKNGKEIYEGDIITGYSEAEVDLTGQVIYVADESSFLISSFELEATARLGEFFSRDLEVIGNIHQNPELLK